MHESPDVDFDDETLTADDAPAAAAAVPDDRQPLEPPPDEGDGDAERKEDTE